jgi:hypothetical protein
VVLGFKLRTSSLLGTQLLLESYPMPLFFSYFSHRVSVFVQGNLEHNPTYANHGARATAAYSCVDTWLIR